VNNRDDNFLWLLQCLNNIINPPVEKRYIKIFIKSKSLPAYPKGNVLLLVVASPKRTKLIGVAFVAVAQLN
jgi:hypothetical protein